MMRFNKKWIRVFSGKFAVYQFVSTFETFAAHEKHFNVLKSIKPTSRG